MSPTQLEEFFARLKHPTIQSLTRADLKRIMKFLDQNEDGLVSATTSALSSSKNVARCSGGGVPPFFMRTYSMALSSAGTRDDRATQDGHAIPAELL